MKYAVISRALDEATFQIEPDAFDTKEEAYRALFDVQCRHRNYAVIEFNKDYIQAVLEEF